MEGELPLCQTGRACPIPVLRPEAQRVNDIRGLLVSLHDLVGPETICRICNVQSDELLLLAAVEDELKRCSPPPKQDGQ